MQIASVGKVLENRQVRMDPRWTFLCTERSRSVPVAEGDFDYTGICIVTYYFRKVQLY